MRISDWSSDVCSSDLTVAQTEEQPLALFHLGKQPGGQHHAVAIGGAAVLERDAMHHRIAVEPVIAPALRPIDGVVAIADIDAVDELVRAQSELQSLMRISYALFCFKKKNEKTNQEN